MNAQEFLVRTVGDNGLYCLFVLNRHTNRKRQLFFTTTSDLVDAALDHDARGSDTYFALATFADDSSRTVANAHQLRSFFVDLDCGEDKAASGDGYIDQRTALVELRKFCRGYGLPRPLIVNSGRGVHAYWTLPEPVPVAEWLPVAKALKAACAERGLLADPAVTDDVARILRLPETHNHKDDPASEVVVWVGSGAPDYVTLEEMREALGADALAPRATRVVMPEGMSAMQKRLMSNTTSRFRTIVERTANGDGCAQIGAMLRDPASVSEPMWRAGLSIAKHCVDSDKAVQVISRGHPEYDPGDAAEKASRIKHGPYTCAKFDDGNPGICDACPHNGRIKSPIVLGQELATAVEETVTIEVKDKATGITKEYDVPKLPHPYVRGASGGVYKLGEDDDGNPEHTLVYPNDFYVAGRSYDKLEGMEYAKLCLHLPKDGVREFLVPLHHIHSGQELRKELGAKGITLRGNKQWETMGYYLMDWIEELQMTTTASTAYRQFGWTEDMQSFLLGDREYLPGAVRNNTPTPLTQQYIPYFQPKGALEDWVDLIDVYNQPGLEVYQLIMCASFGAALMAFMPDRGLTIHLNSETGFGKTTLQLAAQSVWGAPEQLALAEKDTGNSKLLRLELLKNMLVVFDEMTNVPPAEVSDLLYAVTQGRQKNRMSGGANAERLRGDPWALIAISSGNASFTDKLDVLKANSEAEKARVFEIRLARHVKAAPKADMTAFERRIKEECYGHAGDVFMRYVVAHKKSVEALLHEVQVRLDNAAGFRQEDRFKSSGLSAALAAGVIAHKLGLLKFDMAALFQYTVELVDARRTEAEASMLQPEDHLTAYLAENANNILRIDSKQRGGVTGGGEDALVVPDAQPRGEFVARYEPDIGKLYLLPAPLRAWCAVKQLSYAGLLTDLAERLPLQRNVKKLLTKGTSMTPMHAKVTVIDMELPRETNTTGPSGG